MDLKREDEMEPATPLLKTEADEDHDIRYSSYPSVSGAHASLDVVNLSYEVGRRPLKEALEFVKSLTPQLLISSVPQVRTFEPAANLAKINFRAEVGKITAIMGPDETERRTLTDLLGERRKYGEFDGNILINGVRPGTPYEDNIAFVPRKSLYIPGLTYFELVMYAARLRISDSIYLGESTADRSSAETSYLLEKRVNEVLDIMGLSKMRHRRIEERPVLRGELGGDLRRLSIAMEIVALPPVIILDDPLFGMDPGVTIIIFNCLKRLAQRGHVVVCSLVKPMPQVFAEVDSLVLLSNGRSIYSGEIKYLESFFCSAAVGYKRRKQTDMVDFLLDIALGTERPGIQREAFTPQQIQTVLEKSPMYSGPSYGSDYVVANADSTMACFGYLHEINFSGMFRQTITILSRSLYVKFREFEIIKKSIGGAVVLALYVGLLEKGNGSFGYYCSSFFGLPYGHPSNITGCLFFSCSVMFIQQVLNVHILCQKMQLYRYEQKTHICPPISFTLATFLSEIPFTAFYALVYANVMYYLVELNVGFGNYVFFMEVLLLTAMIALVTAMLFASVLRKEIIVRDIFLLCVFSMLLFSGYPFQFSGLVNNFEKVAQINPMRWSFEALMVWKFMPYEDGFNFLKPYAFEQYDKNDIYQTLSTFIVISSVCFFVSTLPPLNFLRRKLDVSVRKRGYSTKSGLSRASSMDSDTGDRFDSDIPIPTRATMPIKPIIFSRESSITAKSNLSISLSQTGEKNTEHGPTLTLEEVSYRIKDMTSPLGERTVLQNISGQFDWGKLSMIMGCAQSGKSTLLHIIAGDAGDAGNVSGNVLFNREPVASTVLPWQRCAFVEAHDEQFRDLTVLDVVTYAMKLRCLNRKGLSVVEENVARTLDLLSLNDVKNTKAKNLGPGDFRRLSIAEEIVHGPALLLIDEPTTGLPIKDIASLLMTFREMVNQDKTVVATMHQPSAAAFKVFDTVMLLSRGRVIYHGDVEKAQMFFLDSPYGFSPAGYDNPADYLLDISAGILKDSNNTAIASLELAKFYENSDQCTYHPVIGASTGAVDDNVGSLGASVWRGEPSEDFESPLNRASQDYHSIAAGSDGKDSALRKSEHALHHGMEAHASIGATSFGAGSEQGSTLYRVVYDYIVSVANTDFDTYLWKLSVLTERSTLALVKREKLVVGSLILYVVMGAVMGAMLGDTNRVTGSTIITISGVPMTMNSSTYEYNTTAFFAISCLLLIFTNVQMIYYWMKSNEVFFKEHSRGLYSNVQQWLTASPALYVLRIINTCCYAFICYDMLSLRNKSEIMLFYLLSINMAVVAGTILCEAVAVAVPDIRAAYQAIPAVVFFNFAFSGIFVKTPTLPDWAHWLPTISLFRWTVQAQAINIFSNDNTLPCVEMFDFCVYDSFLALFGWGHKSKWSCFWIIVINLVIYRVLILLALLYRTFSQKGKRQFRKAYDEFDKLY